MELRPTAGSAFEWLRGDLEQWSGGATALQLMATAREDSTQQQYGRHWAMFVAWCLSQRPPISPMPATPRMMAAYVGYLAERGTIGADSLQPYLSAINSRHADHGLERPAVGHLITIARDGMRRAQARVQTTDTRVPLPADVVERVLRSTLALLSERRRVMDERAFCRWLRRRYAIVLTFIFMGRQDSSVHLRARDHGVDDDFIWLRLTEKQKRGWRWRRIVRLPLSARAVGGHASLLPLVARLGRAFLAARKSTRATSDFLFTLEGEAKRTTAHMGTWLVETLSEEGVAAPAGFAYLGHSLRSGGSSAAEAILVPRFRGNWLGGWAQTSKTRELHYIDPSILPTPSAYALLGWLLHGEYLAEPTIPERAPGTRALLDVGEP
jgi:hypothetical protein